MKRAAKPRPPIDQLESVFKALADKTRLRILALLGNNEVCVCHIHDSLGLPQPTVSRHLAYLRRAGLVDVRRDGVWMHYQVARSLDPAVQTVLNAAVEALTRVRTTDGGPEAVPAGVWSAVCDEHADRWRVLCARAEPMVISAGSDCRQSRLLETQHFRSTASTSTSAPWSCEEGTVVGAAAVELYADGALAVGVVDPWQGQGLASA